MYERRAFVVARVLSTVCWLAGNDKKKYEGHSHTHKKNGFRHYDVRVTTGARSSGSAYRCRVLYTAETRGRHTRTYTYLFPFPAATGVQSKKRSTQQHSTEQHRMYSIAQHSTVRVEHSTVKEYSAVLYSCTAQHSSTSQRNTEQHTTAHHNHTTAKHTISSEPQECGFDRQSAGPKKTKRR